MCILTKKKKTNFQIRISVQNDLPHSPNKSPFQQVFEYHQTHSGIDFSNCILNFFLELYNTLMSIPMDIVLEIIQQKKVQISNPGFLAATCKFAPQKILPKKTSCLSSSVVVNYLVEKLHHIHLYTKVG